ncbi:MAG: type IV pilus modification protein PilV [Methylococcaceae bacterium]|nr:type IV pilus modification protein PilV [Methylococcaceae bacterium]
MIPTPKPKSSGFTLVEVLIAVVILSVGMLGLMGLQTVGLRQNHSSQTRSYAVEFINELADRMRANRAGVDANNYAVDPLPAPLPTPPTLPADPRFDCINSYPGGGTLCDPAQMAQADLFAWKTSADFMFPQSQTTVTCTDSQDPGFIDADGDGINDADTDGDGCTDGSLFVVSLSWVDDRSPNPNNPLPPANFRVTFVP